MFSVGSQAQALSRVRLLTESKRGCKSRQAYSQTSAATLPAGARFSTAEQTAKAPSLCGQEGAKPCLTSTEILCPSVLSRTFSGPLLHTRCQASSVTTGLALSPSASSVKWSRCFLLACSSVENELKHSKDSARSLARSKC